MVDHALLGNAGEFLDLVFSSGVTIALRSAHLAAKTHARQLGGESVDWQADCNVPLRKGIDTFRAFVDHWYTGELQDILYYPPQTRSIRRMICAVLAGYAWDEPIPMSRTRYAGWMRFMRPAGRFESGHAGVGRRVEQRRSIVERRYQAIHHYPGKIF